MSSTSPLLMKPLTKEVALRCAAVLFDQFFHGPEFEPDLADTVGDGLAHAFALAALRAGFADLGLECIDQAGVGRDTCGGDAVA
jgi:hypothetical protein